MASMRIFVTFQILISLFSIGLGTDVPALIWSPNRPLSDLPDIFAGHSVSTSDFQSKYLKPLTGDDVTALVVFVQDRLSVDDFTNYADVYNPDSTGGAFHNVKEFMDEHFSVHLPNVKSPLEALEKLRKTYQGKVYELEAPYGVDQLSLHQGGNNLIVVHLPKTRDDKPEKSIAENDKLIAKVLFGLSEKKVKYTAIYTAKSSSQDHDDALKYTGRHLLQNEAAVPLSAGVNTNNSIFVNSSCILLYARAINLRLTHGKMSTTYNLGKLNGVPEVPDCNVTRILEMKFHPNSNLTDLTELMITLEFEIKPLTQGSDWYISNASFTFSGMHDNMTSPVRFDGQKIWAPRGLSYHCAFPDPIMELNTTQNRKAGLTVVSLQFDKIQMQPFGVKRARFDLAWDCVGFFTIPIWMALFSILILLLILAYGLYSILDIKVMDRFDDPKGKTITINAQE